MHLCFNLLIMDENLKHITQEKYNFQKWLFSKMFISGKMHF